MKDVAFLYPPYHKRALDGSMFPLGIGYLISGVLERNQTFDYINCQLLRQTDVDTFDSRLAEELSREEYRLIAISSVTSDAIPHLEEIIAAARAAHPSTPIIVGGQLVSVDYVGQQIMERFDIDGICRGEGDHALPDLLEYLRAGGCFDECGFITTRAHQGVLHRVADIDSLPIPYRTAELLAQSKLSYRRSTNGSSPVPMITSRGCPYSCNYCVSGCNCTGKEFRKRSWDSIAREVRYLQTEYDIHDIGFYDDCFFWNKNTVNEDILEFQAQLKAHRCDPFAWQMEIRADIMAHITRES